MAKPLVLEIAPRNPRAELQAKLDEAPVEHAEAILSAYEVLQELHESGALELARGVMGARDKVVETLVDALKSPDSVKAMRNAIILAQAFGAIEPQLLKGMVAPLTKTMGAVSTANKVFGRIQKKIGKPALGGSVFLVCAGLLLLRQTGFISSDRHK